MRTFACYYAYLKPINSNLVNMASFNAHFTHCPNVSLHMVSHTSKFNCKIVQDRTWPNKYLHTEAQTHIDKSIPACSILRCLNAHADKFVFVWKNRVNWKTASVWDFIPNDRLYYMKLRKVVWYLGFLFFINQIKSIK